MHSPNKELRSRPQVDEKRPLCRYKVPHVFEVALLTCISCPPNTLGNFSEYLILKKVGKIMKGRRGKMNPQEQRLDRVTSNLPFMLCMRQKRILENFPMQ